MKKEYLQEILKQGEGLSIEFKESKIALNRDVYETICAFLNRIGGTIILGVKDNGEPSGVDIDYIEQIKRDFKHLLIIPRRLIHRAT